MSMRVISVGGYVSHGLCQSEFMSVTVRDYVGEWLCMLVRGVRTIAMVKPVVMTGGYRQRLLYVLDSRLQHIAML